MFLEATQLQFVFKDSTLRKGDPQLADFSGRTYYDKPYDFKAFGSVTLPFRIILAGVFNYTAGTPYTDYDYANRRLVGEFQSKRSPHLMNIDMRLEKAFRIGEGRQLRLMADAFNLTNRENVYTIVQDISGRIGEYGSPYTLAAPRSFQLGARFEW
jgi:hypothetical protein